jgi:uncharacterized membrane protein SpoIIM required for sporulation
MNIAEQIGLIETRRRELESLVDRLSRARHPRTAKEVLRLSELHRRACADLMLAEAYDFPAETVENLHALVGRSHYVLHRGQGFRWRELARILFVTAPGQLRRDPAQRVAAVVFFGSLLISAGLAATQPDFASSIAGDAFLEQIDSMYSQPIEANAHRNRRDDAAMTGFYLQHNTTIGLQCFAWGVFFGLGSLYQLLTNGLILGAIFGHLASGPNAWNFFGFITAHSVFELSAIVIAGGAGLRLGWGLIDSGQQSRAASLRREARRALPGLAAAVVLFVVAAFIEGYLSASILPFGLKVAVALVSAGMLVAYLSLGDSAPSLRPHTQ